MILVNSSHLSQKNTELLAPVDYNHIYALTSIIHERIRSGILDSPSWGLVRTAKVAARIYAPLGTKMSLGDHIRVIRTFLGAFKDSDDTSQLDAHPTEQNGHPSSEAVMRARMSQDLKVRKCYLVVHVSYK
jgi:glycerol-3-phosphate O-acyltransferase/dihydroxyacetone phosphate acyltransferase